MGKGAWGKGEYSSVQKAKREKRERDLAAQKKRIEAKKKIGKARRGK